MPVEIFTKEQFEAALPMKKDGSGPAWTCNGVDKGEYTYHVHLGEDKPARVLVRSSVGFSGKSAACGEDSIRCYVVDKFNNPLSGKVHRWTTRMPGWQERMMEIIRFLAKMAMKICTCPKCKGDLLRLNKVKKEGPNKNRWFLSCWACNNHFEWCDVEPTEKHPCPGGCGDLQEFTVKKEGKNQGRKFRTCPNVLCGVFEWVKEE